MRWTLGSVRGLRGSTTLPSSTAYIPALRLHFVQSLSKGTSLNGVSEASIRFLSPGRDAHFITTGLPGTWLLTTHLL